LVAPTTTGDLFLVKEHQPFLNSNLNHLLAIKPATKW